MSMFNDIVWGERGNTEECEEHSVTVANYALMLLDQKRKGTELTLMNQTEFGTKLLNKRCSTLQKAVIRYFVPPAPWKEEN